MSDAEVLSALRGQVFALRQEGVEHLAIFGSRPREDARGDSDLDVLIDIAPGRRFSLLDLSGVALLIEDATAIPTQVVLRRSIPPDFAARIADNLIPVF